MPAVKAHAQTLVSHLHMKGYVFSFGIIFGESPRIRKGIRVKSGMYAFNSRQQKRFVSLTGSIVET